MPKTEESHLREIFAGQALAGLTSQGHGISQMDYQEAARRAYDYADAMLEERRRRQPRRPVSIAPQYRVNERVQ